MIPSFRSADQKKPAIITASCLMTVNKTSCHYLKDTCRSWPLLISLLVATHNFFLDYCDQVFIGSLHWLLVSYTQFFTQQLRWSFSSLPKALLWFPSQNTHQDHYNDLSYSIWWTLLSSSSLYLSAFIPAPLSHGQSILGHTGLLAVPPTHQAHTTLWSLYLLFFLSGMFFHYQ